MTRPSGATHPPSVNALSFLHDHLIPHAQAEDAVLYPEAERVMRAPGATATMRRDHVEVMVLTRQLQQLRDELCSSPTADQRRGLQRLLYGLYAVVRLHFAKEEEIYLPLLDTRLTPDEAADMFAAMHDVANTERPGRRDYRGCQTAPLRPPG